MITYLNILALSFIQNVSFSLASRSRNRDHRLYHAICAVFSNGLWFWTMRELVLAELTILLAIPYVIGTVAGSLFGAEIAMKIERMIGAKT